MRLGYVLCFIAGMMVADLIMYLLIKGGEINEKEKQTANRDRKN